MKKMLKLAVVMFLSLATLNLSAQDMGMSDILTQVADGIKPEAFKGKFNKNSADWKDQVSKLGADDIDGAKAQLGSLLGGLKGKAFSGVSKASLLTQLAGINGKEGIGSLLSSLLGGLDPSMLTDGLLKNKDSLMGALKMMK
jgi:hypothetical protein